MKKFFSIIMCLVLIAPCVVFSSCKKTEKNYSIINANDAVAEFSIITYDGVSETKNMLKNLGHSFLSIKNLTGENLAVGNFTLGSNEIVTFGTWSIFEHFGVWYNVESNYIEYSNKYDGRISISQNISSSELNKINKFISSHDMWSPIHNCSFFAINCWNEIADTGEVLNTYFIYKPFKLSTELKNFENYKFNIDLKNDYKMCYFKNSQLKEFNF